MPSFFTPRIWGITPTVYAPLVGTTFDTFVNKPAPFNATVGDLQLIEGVPTPQLNPFKMLTDQAFIATMAELWRHRVCYFNTSFVGTPIEVEDFVVLGTSEMELKYSLWHLTAGEDELSGETSQGYERSCGMYAFTHGTWCEPLRRLSFRDQILIPQQRWANGLKVWLKPGIKGTISHRGALDAENMLVTQNGAGINFGSGLVDGWDPLNGNVEIPASLGINGKITVYAPPHEPDGNVTEKAYYNWQGIDFSHNTNVSEYVAFVYANELLQQSWQELTATQEEHFTVNQAANLIFPAQKYVIAARVTLHPDPHCLPETWTGQGNNKFGKFAWSIKGAFTDIEYMNQARLQFVSPYNLAEGCYLRLFKGVSADVTLFTRQHKALGVNFFGTNCILSEGMTSPLW